MTLFMKRNGRKGRYTMPKVTFVIGATATGKTYFIQHNYQEKEIDILNVYDYQQRVYEEEGFVDAIPVGEHFRCLMRANMLLLDDIVEKLTQGLDVIVEQTFYKAKRRISYIDKIRTIPGVTIEIYVMCPSEALWKSNIQKRKLEGNMAYYQDIAKEIEFPNVAEGIDAIYEVVDGEVRLRMDSPRPEIAEIARKELTEEADRIRIEEEEKRKRQELLDSMKERKFWHYCEVCGKKKFLTAQEAFDGGWDYPPQIGRFGLLGPRTCGNCHLKDTLYWKIHQNKKLPIVCEGELSPEELVTWRRIKGEPESLLQDEG